MKVSHAALAIAFLGRATLATAETTKEVFPLVGDARRGAIQFSQLCAGCHGATGDGSGVLSKHLTPPAGAVRGSELSVSRSDQQLYDAVVGGGAAVGKSALMPAFGSALTPLDAWDLVAYLRQGQPQVLDFFPGAGRVLAKTYTVDSFGLDRLQKALGATVPPELATMQVVTVFNGEREKSRAPTIEAQDPVTLDSLKTKDKLGYLVFVDTQLPTDGHPLPIGLATDAKGHIVRALSLTGTADDAGRNAVLAGLVGQGQKGGAHVPFKVAAAPKAKPVKGAKAKPAPAAAGPLVNIDASYQRAMEAVTMYDKEERDRTWADAPSK